MKRKDMIVGIDVCDYEFSVTSSIEEALNDAKSDLNVFNETLDTIKIIRPDCDKIDYILSATSGILCGIIDVFLVGKPGESPIGEITDEWFENRTKDFAKLFGWNNEDGKTDNAIKFLEKKFKIPYDQVGIGDVGKEVFNLTPKNHHMKSLAHNPTLLGLFFSILDQFNNTSHFVSDGDLIILENVRGDFTLKGTNIISKIFCGFINWIGHLMSDISGSSSSKGRGMGIPSPFMAWINDIVAIRRKLNIPKSEFDSQLCELSIDLFTKGYDLRFQTAQMIPVVINELLVRFMYSTRRFIKYIAQNDKEYRSKELFWKNCKPYGNPSVKRMLTVAHGTFCAVDLSDAVIRGTVTKKVDETLLRVNVIGIGRFTVSLYGEIKQDIDNKAKKQEIVFIKREKIITEEYIQGLVQLSRIYDDKDLMSFVEDVKSSELYMEAFNKSVLLAQKRNVPESDVLKSKKDIDKYFRGEM